LLEVPVPVAEFSTENEITSGCAPLTIDFVDLSKIISEPIKEIIWNYGDSTSGSFNVGSDSLSSHTFNLPGKYDITFIIILDNGCSDTLVKKEFILVGELPVSAGFNINFSDTICYGETLAFEALSTYSNPTYFADYFCWAFEEGENPILTNDKKPPLDCPEGISSYLPSDLFVNFKNPEHTYNNFKYENAAAKSGYNYIGEMNPSDSTLSTHLIIGHHGCYQEVTKKVHVKPTSAMLGFAFEDLKFNLIACDSSKTIGIYNASVNYDSLLYFRIVYEPILDTVKHIAEFDTVFYKFDQPGDYSIQIGVFNKTSLCQSEVSRTFHVVSKDIKMNIPSASCWKKEITAIDESTYSKGIVSSRKWLLQGSIKSFDLFPTVNNDTLREEVTDTGWNVFSLVTLLRLADDLIGPSSDNVECPYVYLDSMYVEGTVVKIKLDTNIACGGDSVLLTNISTSTSGFEDIEWYLKDSTTVLNLTDSFKTAYDVANTYTHTLVVNNSFGCSDTLDSPSLLVSKPAVIFDTNDTVVCQGGSVTFNNSSKGHQLSHTWGVESNNYVNINATHTFLVLGEFDIKLHAVDVYGCEDSITHSEYVRVSPIPTSEFETLNINVNCPPFTIQFLDTSKTASTEWQWAISDGGIGTTQNYLHTFITAGKFDVEFTSTNKDGCTNTIIKPNYVTVTGPAATVTANETSVCSPDSVKFNMDMTDVAFYVWDFNDGVVQSNAVTSNKDSTTHNYSKNGLISPIFIVMDSNDCVVVIPNIPAIAVDSLYAQLVAPQSPNCNLDSIHFINNSTSYFQSSFTWDFGDGNSGTDSLGVNKYADQGTYDIKLMMESSIGCLDTNEIKLTLYLDPGKKLSVLNDYFCVPTTTTLQLNYSNLNFVPEEVYFKLEGEKIVGDSISLAFSEAKSYNMSVHVTYGGGNCMTDSTFTHEYYELPFAEFDYNPKKLSLETPEISFTSSSTNTTIWNWNFGDERTQIIENPAHKYLEANNYPVQLIASNKGGCTDTAVIIIPLAPANIIQLPNAFTPDNDGFNDEFGILFAGNMDILSFKIFNRWGNMVFRTGDITEKWDGQYKGEPQNHGTYVYYVKGRNEQGEISEYKGNFSLIR
ncbi:MAG: gliding motility-associated-like protein, partial [Saprospiraceae bacterium]